MQKQKSDHSVLCNGGFLAELLNASRNTISAWTAQGMPLHKRGERGEEHAYNMAHCFRWSLARDIANQRNIGPLDALAMVLLGDAIMAREDLTSFAQWKPRAMKIVKEMDRTERDFDVALGQLINSGLLAQTWSKGK